MLEARRTRNPNHIRYKSRVCALDPGKGDLTVLMPLGEKGLWVRGRFFARVNQQGGVSRSRGLKPVALNAELPEVSMVPTEIIDHAHLGQHSATHQQGHTSMYDGSLEVHPAVAEAERDDC